MSLPWSNWAQADRGSRLAGTLTTWPRVPACVWAIPASAAWQAQEFGQGLALRNLTIEERDRHRLGEGWRTSAALSTARMRDCADGVRSSQTAAAGLKLTRTLAGSPVPIELTGTMYLHCQRAG